MLYLLVQSSLSSLNPGFLIKAWILLLPFNFGAFEPSRVHHRYPDGFNLCGFCRMDSKKGEKD